MRTQSFQLETDADEWSGKILFSFTQAMMFNKTDDRSPKARKQRQTTQTTATTTTFTPHSFKTIQ